MIKKVKIKGLRGRGNINLDFFDDINVITGANGIGKTTVIKLIWYVYSGNLNRAISEIEFKEIELTTKTHRIKVFESSNELLATYDENVSPTGYELLIEELHSGKRILDTLRERADISYCENIVSKINERSLYFPTFRRIEGFSKLNNNRFQTEFEEEILDNAMSKISNLISINDHRYITSVATKDITELITSQYAKVSDKINNEYKILSDNIQHTIKDNMESEDNNNLREQLNKIRDYMNENNLLREKALSPINKINELVDSIFSSKGINIGKTFSFGATKEKIDSEYLSSGEKQMLSFITYNAFYSNIPFFVDEPEISLHVDWQRRLLSILSSQRTNNQIIIATHSPFIYTKYSDKEIMLDKEVDSFYGE